MIIVTGLPRSGTSYLTNLVHQMTDFNLGHKNAFKPGDSYNKQGYFEHLDLNKITVQIEKSLKADFFLNIPVLYPGWHHKFPRKTRRIRRIITRQEIQILKDNRLLVYGDIYQSIYPDAKWIYIERSDHETFKSRFGNKLDYEHWKEICDSRRKAWKRTNVCQDALHLTYADFEKSVIDTISRISSHLNIQLDSYRTEQLAGTFIKINS